MLATLLLLHIALAALAPVAGRRLGPRIFLLCGLAPLFTFMWAAARAPEVFGGEELVQRIAWVAGLGLHIDLLLDGFALLMVGLISGIGVLVFAYAHSYFRPRPGLGRFAGILTAFAGSMLGLVIADNLLALYLFWELTSITSYLLIGFEDDKAAARSSALQAILVTGAGGLAMLGGFVLIGQAAGTYTMSEILADPPDGSLVGVGLVLALLGAFTKSAQVPFHFWLPAAMAAPTPVSAYLHSATMVKAGVYLIARLAPAFTILHAWWRPTLIGVGLTTMLIGGLRALAQHDLKLLLAHSTVGQLGFLVVLLGAGYPTLTFAGVAVLLAHALFKATLFMVVGIIDHQAHTRDIRKLSGIGRRFPYLFAVAAVAVASMAGLPPLFGFVAKEAALEAVLHDAGWIVAAGLTGGSILTFAYGARFLWGAFATKAAEPHVFHWGMPHPREPGSGIAEDGIKAPSRGFVAPAAILAALSLALGLLLPAAAFVVRGAAGALDPRARDGSLYLWHGFTWAVGLSAVTVGTGLLAFAKRHQIQRLQAQTRLRFGAEHTYQFLLRGLNTGAGRFTGVIQNGSLPIYITIILLTAVALPSSALLRSAEWSRSSGIADSPLQALVVAAVLVAAGWMARVRQRFAVVMLLGAVGYGVAVLFMIQGAPDLALTQLLIETLALVIFVLVLRHLPPRFEAVRWRFGNILRLAVAASVGLFVAVFALQATSLEGSDHVSREFVARALPEGGGRNIVNVILTDFRALDTLGEITVLAVAAMGIASLILAGIPGRKEPADEV
ncbi:MAG: DUF4040 domain-containing protein [Actinomycetota bacterium]|nr:DUF4040 domain-containing protein [Actinomycetota bacterium]